MRRLVTKNKITNQTSRLVQSNRSNCRKIKDAIKLCQDVLTTEQKFKIDGFCLNCLLVAVLYD